MRHLVTLMGVGVRSWTRWCRTSLAFSSCFTACVTFFTTTWSVGTMLGSAPTAFTSMVTRPYVRCTIKISKSPSCCFWALRSAGRGNRAHCALWMGSVSPSRYFRKSSSQTTIITSCWSSARTWRHWRSSSRHASLLTSLPWTGVEADGGAEYRGCSNLGLLEGPGWQGSGMVTGRSWGSCEGSDGCADRPGSSAST